MWRQTEASQPPGQECFVLHKMQINCTNSLFKVLGRDFDTLSSHHALEGVKRVLDTDVAQWGGHEQRSDGGDDGALQTTQHNGVSLEFTCFKVESECSSKTYLVQHTVDENDVDGGAKPLQNLHLQNGGLECLAELETSSHAVLRQGGDEVQQIRDALARVCRCGDNVNVVFHVLHQ